MHSTKALIQQILMYHTDIIHLEMMWYPVEKWEVFEKNGFPANGKAIMKLKLRIFLNLQEGRSDLTENLNQRKTFSEKN